MMLDLRLVALAYQFGYTIDYLESLPVDTLALLEGFLDAKNKLEARASRKPR